MASSKADNAILAMRQHLQKSKKTESLDSPAPSPLPSSRFTWRSTWWRPLILSICVLIALVIAWTNWSKGQHQEAIPTMTTVIGVFLVIGAAVGIWRRPSSREQSLRERWERWKRWGSH